MMDGYEADVVLTARAWWKQRCPADWSLDDHLAQPTVNCTGNAERLLAQAVAAWFIQERQTLRQLRRDVLDGKLPLRVQP